MKKTCTLVIITLLALAPATRAQTEGASAVLQLAAKGPGTQTEDELYIGARNKASTDKATAGKKTSGAKQPTKAAKPRKGGDDDLEDLEVQRAKGKRP